MIKTVKIRNLRGFKSVRLEDCRRLNVVVGDNGSGKTALLEALFLLGGPSPEVAIRLRQWRGFEGALGGSPKMIEDALWRDLFHEFDKKRRISISATGSESHTRSLAISFNPSDVKIPLTESAGPVSVQAPITFEWEGPFGKQVRVTPTVVGGTLQLPPLPETATETFFFGASIPYSAIENAMRFSILSKASREDEFIKVFNRQFGNVADISIELVGITPMLFAKTADFSERVPLALLSGGLNKFASVLTAVASHARSVVLIDEIENGLYFRRLPGLWKTLQTLCRENDVQVFASTHSAECLLAAAELAEQSPDDFSVIQVTRKEGQSELIQFGGDKFSDALNENIEIR